MFSDHIYEELDNALDLGITEKEFWEMTFAELRRLSASKVRVMEIQDKKQASLDYILADLIGRSVSRVYNSANKMPSLSEAYPSLFDKEEEQEKVQSKKDELSALRLKLFAESYNKKFKEVAKVIE